MVAPSDEILAEALGPSRPRWDELVELLESEHPSLRAEWKSYGPKHGWQLELVDRKRNVPYLIPKAGTFVAAVALSDAGVEALRASRHRTYPGRNTSRCGPRRMSRRSGS